MINLIPENINILHVDDEPIFLDLTKRYLTKLQNRIQIFSVETVETALHTLQKKAFDVIISDYQMYPLNGLDLLETLRSSNDITPLIIFSGKNREEIVIRAFNLGANYFIQKGLNLETNFLELVHFINEIIDKKKEMKKRKSIENKLCYRVQFENLIAQISTRLINLDYNVIDKEINNALEEIGIFLEIDRCSVATLSEKNNPFTITHHWNAPGVVTFLDSFEYVQSQTFLRLYDLIKKRHIFHIPDVNEVLSYSEREKAIFQLQGDKSFLIIPLVSRDKLIGVVSFSTKKKYEYWSEKDIPLLQLFGEIIINALERKSINISGVTRE